MIEPWLIALDIDGTLLREDGTVSDEVILEGLRFLVSRARIVPEPAGAAAVGALLSGAVRAKPGERVVAIVSGGNIDADRLAGYLT